MMDTHFNETTLVLTSAVRALCGQPLLAANTLLSPCSREGRRSTRHSAYLRGCG